MTSTACVPSGDGGAGGIDGLRGRTSGKQDERDEGDTGTGESCHIQSVLPQVAARARLIATPRTFKWDVGALTDRGRRCHRRRRLEDAWDEHTQSSKAGRRAHCRQVGPALANHRGASSTAVSRARGCVAHHTPGAVATRGRRSGRKEPGARRAESEASFRWMPAGGAGIVAAAEDEETATHADPQPRRTRKRNEVTVGFAHGTRLAAIHVENVDGGHG